MWVIAATYTDESGSATDIIGPFHNREVANEYRIKFYPDLDFRKSVVCPMTLPNQK